MEGGATGPKGPCLGCGGAPLALTHMVPPAAAAGVFPSHVRRSGAVGFGRFALVALIAPREVHILTGPAEGWSHQRGLFFVFFLARFGRFLPQKDTHGLGHFQSPARCCPPPPLGKPPRLPPPEPPPPPNPPRPIGPGGAAGRVLG